MVVEWVACLGQTHKNGNNVKMKQEIDKKRGTRKGRQERDKKETRKRRERDDLGGCCLDCPLHFENHRLREKILTVDEQ